MDGSGTADFKNQSLENQREQAKALLCRGVDHGGKDAKKQDSVQWEEPRDHNAGREVPSMRSAIGK